jgi:hypothetical protein
MEYEGAYYHLLSRGNERRDILLCDEDRSLFLDTIGECGARFEIDIFSYVLRRSRSSCVWRGIKISEAPSKTPRINWVVI